MRINVLMHFNFTFNLEGIVFAVFMEILAQM